MTKLKESSRILNGIADTAGKACTQSLKLLKATSASDFEDAVPQIRSNYKKIRAALRLLRDDHKNYKKGNEFYRDGARKILDIQQAIAMVKAIDLINEQYSDRLYKNAFTELRDKLENNKKEKIESALTEEHVFQDMHQNLEGQCDDLKNTLEKPVSRDTIESGLQRVYERGRKAQKKLSDSQTNDDFHELQKRVNYLSVQLGILNSIWPEMIDVWKEELEKLSHLLVTSEGLHQLSVFLKDNGDMNTKEDGVYLMNTLVEGHLEQVRQHALLSAKKIYSLKAKHFMKFIKAAWDAHQLESTQRILPSGKLKLSE